MNDITKLQLYLNDKEGKIFSPEELQMLLDEAGCLYCAVSEGWSLIATRLNLTDTKKYTVGIESYEKAGINDQIKAALSNAEYFKDKCTCRTNAGSFILRTNAEVRS
ncbi:hypothetical protein Amet_2573 [Alkaliphilus metalliredigens QYMF]|uniref:Uncharacterized protein n=1 Tax=Alkaliphilus metalliredigens (strain QYMF) TaxID=293826 RepID=A6TRA7_ALKMQ|nr:hypothetical protein [Alkaliphilus metalliredigens]ABR48725.1 hypothetical protein Amet_2573 [Alkaliphilus metalliredigens QYMF]